MDYVRRESRFFAQARQRAGMTQAELAKALGYDNAQFISNIERGESRLPLNKVRTFCVITKSRLLTYASIKMSQAKQDIRKEIYG